MNNNPSMFQPEVDNEDDSKFILIKILSFDTLQNMFKVEFVDHKDNKRTSSFYLGLF